MVTMKTTGFADLEKALEQLPQKAGKPLLRRALKKAAKPMADLMRDLAPDGPGPGDDLKSSITVAARLSKRQAGLHKKMFKSDKASVQMFVGPGPDPAAWNQEFGNINHGAQPFARPAWEQDKKPLLDRLGVELWADLERSLKRQAKRAAKEAGA
jgi:HK97 gp10 family phage protein